MAASFRETPAETEGKDKMRWLALFKICAVLAVQAVVARQPAQNSTCNDVPAHPFDLIVGRPGSNSVAVSVLCDEDTTGYIAYGTQQGNLAATTQTRSFRKGEPQEIVLAGLWPNTRHYYRFCSARTNSAAYCFHTARPPESVFTFTITADSHLDENIVFHGHDHLYAKQELDGIIYQEVPQPGAPGGRARSAADYGYKRGVLLGSSGFLRVEVSAGQVSVAYVRGDQSVAHAYVISTKQGN